jgi:hypothetical protein
MLSVSPDFWPPSLSRSHLLQSRVHARDEVARWRPGRCTDRTLSGVVAEYQHNLSRYSLCASSPSVPSQWSRLNSRVHQEQEDGDSHCYCGDDTEYGDMTQCPREGDDDADDCSDHVEGHGAESGIRKGVEDF